MAPAGGLQGVPEEQVLEAGHRVQVRTSADDGRGPKRKGDCLLRQYKGKKAFVYTSSWLFFFERC